MLSMLTSWGRWFADIRLASEEAEEIGECFEGTWNEECFYCSSYDSASRISRIVESSSGFVYYVSREGVTGTRDDLAVDLGERVNCNRQKGLIYQS